MDETRQAGRRDQPPAEPNQRQYFISLWSHLVSEFNALHLPLILLILSTVSLAITSPSALAKLSNTTGTMEGRPPTATGTLRVMFPGGATAVTNNAVVSTTLKPSDFGVSTSALTLQDLDGDTGLSSSLDTAAVTWVWKDGPAALTPSQLVAPFSTNFLGKTLTVSASALVTVSSLTGVPTTSGPQPLSSAMYSLVVPATAPVVRVNGASFALNAGFPQTGFSQATFQFWMDGIGTTTNNNYQFTLDQPAPWVTVGQTTGVVTFNSEPTVGQTVNISIKDMRTGAVTPYAFTVATWFINNGSNTTTAAGADSYCTERSGYTAPSYLKMTNAAINNTGTREADGRLWDEWGALSVNNYPSSGWISSTYWAIEATSTYRYEVALNTGTLYSIYSGLSRHVACSRAL